MQEQMKNPFLNIDFHQEETPEKRKRRLQGMVALKMMEAHATEIATIEILYQEGTEKQLALLSAFELFHTALTKLGIPTPPIMEAMRQYREMVDTIGCNVDDLSELRKILRG